MQIDWQTDTYDGGLHLNADGAEKFTKFFGRILADKYGLGSRKNESDVTERWNTYLEEYKTRKKQMEDGAQ